jgi:hypothetical protein
MTVIYNFPEVLCADEYYFNFVTGKRVIVNVCINKGVATAVNVTDKTYVETLWSLLPND